MLIERRGVCRLGLALVLASCFGFGSLGAGSALAETMSFNFKEDCKEEGWKNFNTTFKNQGQCVSFVTTGGAHT
jgi:hypothetical protein